MIRTAPNSLFAGKLLRERYNEIHKPKLSENDLNVLPRSVIIITIFILELMRGLPPENQHYLEEKEHNNTQTSGENTPENKETETGFQGKVDII